MSGRKRAETKATKKKRARPSRNNQNRRPPPPPPPPPASLVALLQSDPTVLHYFQALQTSLDGDVQIWKDRAQKYQQNYEQLLQKQQQQQENDEPETATKHTMKAPAATRKASRTKGAHSNSNNNKKSKGDDDRGKKGPSATIIGGETKAKKNKDSNDKPGISNTLSRKKRRHQPAGSAAAETTTVTDKRTKKKRSTAPAKSALSKVVASQQHNNLSSQQQHDAARFEIASSSDDDDNNSGNKNHEDDVPFPTEPPAKGSTAPKSAEAAEEALERAVLFELGDSSSSSDDDDDDDDHIMEHDDDDDDDMLDHSTAASTTLDDAKERQEDLEYRQQRLETYRLLQQAYSSLEKLGIRLVEDEIVDDPEEEHEKPSEGQQKTDTLNSEHAPAADAAATAANVTQDTGDDVAQNHSQRQPQNPTRVDDNNDDSSSVSSTEMTFIKHWEQIETASSPHKNETMAVARKTAAVAPLQKDDAASVEAATSTFQRRSDADVLQDVIQAMKDLSRLYTQYGPDECPPFDPITLVPACNMSTTLSQENKSKKGTNDGDSPTNSYEDGDNNKRMAADDDVNYGEKKNCIPPAVEGKRHLFRALFLIDTLCSSFWSDEEWHGLFDDDNDQDGNDEPPSSQQQRRRLEIKIGMRNRKTLVDDFLRQLTGEIAESWAFTDRSNNRHNAAGAATTTESQSSLEAYGGDPAASASAPVNSGKNVNITTLHGGPKSLARLALIAERCLMAQLVTALYVARDDAQTASQLVLDHVLSTAPEVAQQQENSDNNINNRLPVQSLLVLESLLARPHPEVFWWRRSHNGCDEDNGSSLSWFESTVREDGSSEERDSSCSSGSGSLILSMLSLSIKASAGLWKQLISSTDERIRDTALVEYECFRRLCQREGSWLGGLIDLEDTEVVVRSKNVCEAFLIDQDGDGTQECKSMASWAIELAFLLGNDQKTVEKLMKKCFQDAVVGSSCTDGGGDANWHRFLALARSVKQFLFRDLDRFRDAVGMRTEAFDDHSLSFPDMVALSLPWKELTLPAEPSLALQQLVIVMEAFSTLSNGAAVLEVAEALIRRTNDQQQKDPIFARQYAKVKTVLDSFQLIAQAPVVRVINLERRRDRLKAFMIQSLRAGVLVLRALGNVADEENVTNVNYCTEFGGYAYDGGGRMAEAQTRLVAEVTGSHAALSKLVAPEWRPHDLRPFDRYAPDHENFVLSSTSERACALSHICSWKGALRSMELHRSSEESSSAGCGQFFQQPANLVRLFKISGFAEGPAVFVENECMSPAPVCVILEDDAILSENFVDRLKALLKELPRDFHYCSLGYSRPKTAPIVPYSSLIGIPPMLWYLTGYVISELGAQYLLDTLPVVGPVDTWIGLKMASNWDNTFGVRLGVGNHARPTSELPARRDLRRILRFRAFCALQPLCTQRVGKSVAAATPDRRSWRQRDTDIEYSGTMMGYLQQRY